MIPRRTLLRILGTGLAASPAAAHAQAARKPYRLGFLGNSTPELEAHLVGPFREGLRTLGYVEGRDLVIEYRWADGHYERFPQLVGELLARKADIIVAAGTPPAVAMKKATSTVPLVMIAVADPVGTGLVVSLARPGGNLTGLVSISPVLEGKRIEILREIVPKLARITALTNPSNPYMKFSKTALADAANALHVAHRFMDVSTEPELESSLDSITRERPDAVVVLADRLFLHHRKRIADFFLRERLPGVYAYSELVDAGGLISFGPSYPAMHQRAAYFVDRIFKGEKAGDLPMEQPTRFEVVVNLKTAKALHLTVPQSVLLRADRVIQ